MPPLTCSSLRLTPRQPLPTGASRRGRCSICPPNRCSREGTGPCSPLVCAVGGRRWGSENPRSGGPETPGACAYGYLDGFSKVSATGSGFSPALCLKSRTAPSSCSEPDFGLLRFVLGLVTSAGSVQVARSRSVGPSPCATVLSELAGFPVVVEWSPVVAGPVDGWPDEGAAVGPGDGVGWVRDWCATGGGPLTVSSQHLEASWR